MRYSSDIGSRWLKSHLQQKCSRPPTPSPAASRSATPFVTTPAVIRESTPTPAVIRENTPVIEDTIRDRAQNDNGNTIEVTPVIDFEAAVDEVPFLGFVLRLSGVFILLPIWIVLNIVSYVRSCGALDLTRIGALAVTTFATGPNRNYHHTKGGLASNICGNHFRHCDFWFLRCHDGGHTGYSVQSQRIESNNAT